MSARPPSPSPLTPRQRQVLALVAEGLTDRQVAAHLCIAWRTATTHMVEIRRRLAVPNRAAAVARFCRDTTAR